MLVREVLSQRFSVLFLLLVVLVVVCLTQTVESLTSSSSSASPKQQQSVESINIDKKGMFRSNNMKLRVVSYNVLSSHLSSPSHYTTLNPEHLDPKNRLPVVLDKLQDEITRNKKDGSVVVCCLQEVSYDWAGELHTFFANQGYHMVTGLYGRYFNGYMGVALAWPTEQLQVVNVDISRLADTRPGGWPRQAKTRTGIISSVVSRVKSLVQGSIQTLSLASQKVGLLAAPEEVPPDHWHLSAKRVNVLLTATLKDKATGKIFCAANYHMPCAYYCPMAMTIHADLCAAHVQRIAKKQKEICDADGSADDKNEFYPYFLAGDFNLKPNEPVYELLTTGRMDATGTSHNFYPTPTTSTNSAGETNVVEWSPSLHAMKSAYAEHAGKEPDFTNYARIKKQEPFIDTLDYIFYGPDAAAWKVTDVAALPDRNDCGGPFPNLDRKEPSDHVLIAATLELQ